jgi:hypothetical protein
VLVRGTKTLFVRLGKELLEFQYKNGKDNALLRLNGPVFIEHRLDG